MINIKKRRHPKVISLQINFLYDITLNDEKQQNWRQQLFFRGWMMNFNPVSIKKYFIQRKEHFINKQRVFATRHYKNMTTFRQYDILKFTILLPKNDKEG